MSEPSTSYVILCLSMVFLEFGVAYYLFGWKGIGFCLFLTSMDVVRGIAKSGEP